VIKQNYDRLNQERSNNEAGILKFKLSKVLAERDTLQKKVNGFSDYKKKIKTNYDEFMNKVNAIIKEKENTIDNLNKVIETQNAEIKKLKLSSINNKNSDEINKLRAKMTF